LFGRAPQSDTCRGSPSALPHILVRRTHHREPAASPSALRPHVGAPYAPPRAGGLAARRSRPRSVSFGANWCATRY